MLSLAAEQPMHPYEMASTLRERGMERNIPIKWGSLYTVVGNLEKHGLIEATRTDRQGQRPERTVYAITEAGKAELIDWLEELLGNPERERHRFQAALSVVGWLGPDDTQRLLAVRLRILDADNAAQEATLARLRRDLPRLFLIEAEYELALRRAEAEWVRGLLADMKDGSLPGMSQWREYAETGVVPEWFAELTERGVTPTD